MFTTFFCCLSYFASLHAALLLWFCCCCFDFYLLFCYKKCPFLLSRTCSEIPNLPAERTAWDIQDEHWKNPSQEGWCSPGIAYWGAGGADTLGGFKGWSVVPGLCDWPSNNPVPRELRARASRAAGVQSLCEGHCCAEVMDNASKPGEACRALPRKEQRVARLPVLSKPALYYILLIRTWLGCLHCDHLLWCKREREEFWSFPRLCPIHPELANLLSPCLEACGGAADCWHQGNHIKSSLTVFVLFCFTSSNFLSRGRETT